MKITISRTAIKADKDQCDPARPARMIVNSLRNNPNGGAPVMATAPASHKAPSYRKALADEANASRCVWSRRPA